MGAVVLPLGKRQGGSLEIAFVLVKLRAWWGGGWRFELTLLHVTELCPSRIVFQHFLNP